MDTAMIHQSGVIKKGEEIIRVSDGWMKRLKYDVIQGSMVKGSMLLTNKRLIFLEKPKLFSTGLNVLYSCFLGDIESVSSQGLVSKKINVSSKSGGYTITNQFTCKNAEGFFKQLQETKNNYIEEQVIEAKRVIIEEGNKDKAMEILQKRLARGEITLEEFHQLVQRL